jgi:hypothetical protein
MTRRSPYLTIAGAALGVASWTTLAAAQPPGSSSPSKGAASRPGVHAQSSSSSTAPRRGLAAEDERRFEERFESEIWPLLTRSQGGCVSCHNAKNPSQLHFAPEGAAASFHRLLTAGFLEPENAVGLLARVTAHEAAVRMPPPPAAPWSEEEIGRLREFVNDLYERLHASGVRMDEMFPPELLRPYTPKQAPGGPDNTFLSYTQLRRKIRTLFAEEWQRGEENLFEENLAQFNGADFHRRFDEGTKATASYLSALDALSKDVASRAYLAGSGPFTGRAKRLPSPLALKAPDPAHRAEIARLYRRLLFRRPSEPEVQQSFRFLKAIYAAKSAPEESSLDFDLTVQDAQGFRTSRAVRLPVLTQPLGMYQEYVDQSVTPAETLVRKTLARPFTLKPGLADQRFVLTNEATSGNVSLAGIELKGPLPAENVKKIAVTDPGVQLQGAWQRREADGFISFEDGNNNKGSSRIEIPIQVAQSGRYELTVTWRKSGSTQGGRGRRAFSIENAAGVLVEVHSQDAPVVALGALPKVPPKGEALFYIDQTFDTLPFWDLKTAFRFGGGPDQGIEIRNEGTKRRVVADAVRFFPTAAGKEFVLDDPTAEGGWPSFVFPSFKPFNIVGAGAVSDNNEKKGEMKLLFRPSKASDWQPGRLYRPAIVFPGQVGNDTRVPVVVRAEESTPIVQLAAPLRAQTGAAVTLDASATYNLQRTPLTFTWTQTGGPRVRLADPHASKLTFTVEPLKPEQAAWEGLCRALMKHPDFLFTRPRSLATARDPADRRRLQLVKIAQDLVGRPPTEPEVRLLDGGAPLAQLLDHYLASPEFKEFYFHRVRLALETRGNDVDDEPARLWTYVAVNNLPFRQILTADYTIDPAWQKQSRPAYHGKTGVLTMKGFIKGKPGLPHFNYAAQVTEKFLGYVFEVPPSIVEMREGITAAATTAPGSVCYSCHKVLTPLAYQRLAWTDDGEYRPAEGEQPIDDSDRRLVATYPFRGKGLEAFATQAVNKERFVRTIFQTHFVWYFGREMRWQEDERALYRRLWDDAHRHNYSIKSMLRTLMLSPEYLAGSTRRAPQRAEPNRTRMTRMGRGSARIGERVTRR